MAGLYETLAVSCPDSLVEDIAGELHNVCAENRALKADVQTQDEIVEHLMKRAERAEIKTLAARRECNAARTSLVIARYTRDLLAGELHHASQESHCLDRHWDAACNALHETERTRDLLSGELYKTHQEYDASVANASLCQESLSIAERKAKRFTQAEFYYKSRTAYLHDELQQMTGERNALKDELAACQGSLAWSRQAMVIRDKIANDLRAQIKRLAKANDYLTDRLAFLQGLLRQK